MPNIPGSTAATPCATSRASGLRPRFSANARSATIIAAAPLFKPGALPAVIVPSLRNAGFSLASVSIVVSGRLASSLSKRTVPLRLGNFECNDLILEPSRFLCRAEALLRARRPAVLLFARDAVLRYQILRVPARMLTAERVVQPVPQHAVGDLDIAHALTPSATWHEIRRLIHILHPARDRARRVTREDL